MGCSNARLLVQAPLTSEPGATTNNNPLSSTTVPTSPTNVATDTNNSTTRMHLTGVDLVVERNGSYTLLLTPKTHKQLMPYVLRKKRFRILVDKPRSDQLLTSNEPILNERIMETNKKTKQNPMESTLESIEQIATDELKKANDRVIGGRSIDRGNPEDEDTCIQSDDEGMVEEIVTTIEEDKDLECKVKRKIETKKTYAQHPETHSKITKVVKTEVTEITHTITINDHHDLERARRELGITDVHRLLPTSTWIDQTRFTRYEPTNEIITSKDFPSDTPIKQKTVLAESTTVGRGPVNETIPSSSSISQQKPVEIKKKKKKSKLCSCTRAADDEHDQPPQPQKVIVPPTSTTEQTKKESLVTTTPTPVVKPPIDKQIQETQLISADMKQLITDKKVLLIDYIHSKIFSPSKLFSSNEHDLKARKISSRILDLLRYDRCSSWTQMSEQLTDEYVGNPTADLYLQSMIKTYENLFTSKQSNLLNTFSTIHRENDIKNIHENYDYINTVNQPSVENIEETPEQLQKDFDEKVINADEQVMKEINMTDDIQQTLPIYNEEQLTKMLADISQHKPITLAEAIAYQYIDIEDPKLGLSNDAIQSIKNLFRPLSDESVSNVIRVKRSGEYLTDINLIETNPFEKLNTTEPLIYQLQQTFEPTLDFNEKQFRLLTETILNNKEQYDQLEFDVAKTSLPIYDVKDSSTTDFSQSDSGYSMTTATHESLASKIKIEFEPIHQDIPIPPKRDDLYEDEKIDLDKATKEQLDKHELNHDLIQIIKLDFHGSDKTIGQAILSRELRLDSSDPSDISFLHSLGIRKEQSRILTAFFFPKHTRIIAYSPEPGRFVEAQTTYNPDYPGYKTDTTIIQIQEKQLSSDHHAMQRNIHDDRTSPILSQSKTESETVTPSSLPVQEIAPAAVVSKEKTPEPVHVKKRKSGGTGSLLSCFKSKKPKVGTEQQGQSTIQPTTLVSQTTVPQQTTKPIETKPLIDYAILPDGKRIYIDSFRDRPDLDMSYKPDDFENRFVLPIAKPSSEYELPIVYEIESVANKTEIIEDEPLLTRTEITENESTTHLESRPPIIESQIIEHKPEIHLEPRPATIERVDVQPEKTPVIVPLRKSEPITVTKKLTIDLHGAAVDLPDIQLVEPGPLPTLSTLKVKKSAGGLCASCFGAKSAKQKKKESVAKPIQAPVEQKKISETEKKEDLPPSAIITTTSTTEQSSLPSTTADQPILPKINIDQFKERNFQQTFESNPKPGDRLETTIEKITPTIEPHYQSPSSESIQPTTKDANIFSKVNIDQFKERNFQKSSETLSKTPEQVTPSPPPFEEPHYQLLTNEPASASIIPAKLVESTTKDSSIYSKVNIDQFKERTFDKSSETLSKTVEQVTPPPIEEPHHQLLTNEPVSAPILPAKSFESTTKDSSIYSKVNIDQFKERTFDKSSETLSKTVEQVTPPPIEEPHHQLLTNEPISPPILAAKSFESTTKDSSIYSKVNIDQFKERTFDKSFESLPKSEKHVNATIEQVTRSPEEPHYQLPKNEPISPPILAAKSFESTTKDSSIFSKVNIDQFKERTFEKTPEKRPKPEEPHYQLPSGEPIPSVSLSTKNEYSTSEHNTYDIPRTIELHQTTPSIETKTQEKIMTPPTTDIQKSSGDFHTITHVEEISSGKKTKAEKKKKSKEPKLKTEKKSSLFSTLFRSNERKSPVPALNLPSVEHDLSPNNQLRKPHPDDADPFHIPSTNLPKLDLPLPTYDHPEVDMSSGYTKQSSEFSIPVIDLPSIPNLSFPENDKQSNESNVDPMKIPNVQLPNLQFTLNEHELVKLPEIDLKTKIEQSKDDNSSITPTNESGLALTPLIEDISSIETDHGIKTETSFDKTEIITTQQSVTIIETHLVQISEPALLINEKQTKDDFTFQLPSPEPVLSVPKDSSSSPPSFDDIVPTVVSSIKSPEQQPIEKKSAIKKKSSTLALCSCLGNKSTIPKKEKAHTITVPKASLPQIDMPIPSSNISSILKTKRPLRAPSTDLPEVDLTPKPTEQIHLPNIHIQDKKQKSTNETQVIKERVPTPPPVIEETKVQTKPTAKEIKNVSTESKKSPSFEIKAPVMNVPQLDLSGPGKSDAYLSFSKQSTSIPEQIQSRSDSGLEAIISSHIQPSSTFATIEDIHQHPSMSSGLGSEISKGYTLSDTHSTETKYDFTRKISMNDEIRSKLIFRQNELKKCLETEISKSIENFDSKKDHKSLDKILTHGIDLIKDKKVSTYPELKQKLIMEHKNDAFIVDPVVRSLYFTIEKQGLDNLDKPEFPLAIRDMVRLPAKQTYDTVAHLNKESTSLTTTEMTKEISQVPIEKKAVDTARSCLTCGGRSKSKTKLSPTTSSNGLLDERHREQLNTHRNELIHILRDHIQSSQPPIRKFSEHPKDIEKILRKGLTVITQPKILSYEQIRNDLKTEHKQKYYLIDPIVDIIRDTFDHCDITQMNEKINLDILDSNISQTAYLYNNQMNLLTTEESNAFKSNQLSWLQQYLITNESKEKKLTRKQNKELNKILHRTLEILSSNQISTWEELTLQLQREYPKAQDLCHRSVELMKQSQKDGLFFLQQPPIQDKRRASSLITDRARQNIKSNRNKIISSLKTFLTYHNKSAYDTKQLDNYLNKTFNYLEEQKQGQFKSYQDLKEQLKKDFKKHNHDQLIEQMVDVIEQAHATNQFDDIEKAEVQTLMKDRLDGKPLVIKEMYVSLPPRIGGTKYSNDFLTSINGDQLLNHTTSSHPIARGLSWREANERARILFYRGKHPAIHYDEKAAAFDVRMLLETASGGTQEIPVTDSDIHELLNSCGVQWDGVNIISLVDHSEEVVRAAEQAALKVIREKGLVELRTPPPASASNVDTHDDDLDGTVKPSS